MTRPACLLVLVAALVLLVGATVHTVVADLLAGVSWT